MARVSPALPRPALPTEVSSLTLPHYCCSTVHCKLFLDGNEKAQLVDLSSNGTWWNNTRMGKQVVRPLQHADNIVLLTPNPRAIQHLHSAGSPGMGMGAGGGLIVQRAVNYQFMFIDLRPAPPMPPPPPPMPRNPQLLRGTSFTDIADPLAAMGSRGDYEEISTLGSGSFAVVKRVRHRGNGVEYAMKVMEKRRLIRGAAAGDARVRDQLGALQSKVLMEARILSCSATTVSHASDRQFSDASDSATAVYWAFR